LVKDLGHDEQPNVHLSPINRFFEHVGRALEGVIRQRENECRYDDIAWRAV
jgi:hypothetical protein